LTNRTTSDQQSTTPRQPRKGSDHDSNRHHRTEHDGHTAGTGTGDGSPDSNPNDTQSGSPDSGERSDTDWHRRDRQSTPARRPQRESYAEQQARLDAEAVDRWAITVADWPPMTDEQIRALAVILNRIDARLATQRSRQEGHG